MAVYISTFRFRQRFVILSIFFIQSPLLFWQLMLKKVAWHTPQNDHVKHNCVVFKEYLPWNRHDSPQINGAAFV